MLSASVLSDGRWSTKPRRVINPIVTLSLEEISGIRILKMIHLESKIP